MTTKTLDHLGLCNDQGVPLEDFRLAFCARCFQSECSRSQFGTSKFEARVQTWEERLFKNPPTLPKTDPRFPLISAKKFLALPVGPAPAVREWIDPLTAIDAQPPAIQIPPAVAAPPPRPAKASAPPPVAVPETQPVQVIPVAAEKTPESPPLATPKQNLLVNTPYTGPRTLANQPGIKEPPRDAWAGPVPTKPGEKVVEPGARVKIGRRP